MTTPAPLPAYAAWLERVASTVDAVSYTCRVRLGSATAGDDEVAAALGCDAARAAALRADVLAGLHAIVARSAEVPAEVRAE